MLGRIGLFFLTNILIMVTLSTVLGLLGVGPYITQAGLDYQSLMLFCLVWGMGGAFISLAMSRMMAKMMLRVKVIDPNNPGQYSSLVQMVHDLAKRANLSAMPEVGVYESADINAFATGPTKKRSLVAASTGILKYMSREELEGVMAHEIAHIQNGDMVTMTLIQGVINAFVMFLSRIIAFAVSERVKSENRYMARFAITILLEIVIGLLGLLLINWFSRKREFRADRGSATLSGRQKMIAALEALQRVHGKVREETPHESLATLKISGKPSKFAAFWSTHPPLADRIQALKQYS